MDDPTLIEERKLAAIVFTDVVGYSRLAAKNEARSYSALQRDLGVMTELCRAHGGKVLNTMGDGMLMSFPSAVDAMACALGIQRTFASQAESLPATDILQHRIGVHLGDVIVKGDNVFGDGVNTASRLQTDAKPDSIWFSNTVHDVIKNKLKFDSRYVGPLQFKNLVEPTKVWEVPPIREVNARHQADALGLDPVPSAPPPEGIRGGRAAILVMMSLVLVAVVVFLATRMKPGPPATHPDKHLKIDLGALKPAKPVAPDPDASETGGGKPEATPDAATLAKELEQDKASYEFEAAATLLKGDGKALPGAGELAAEFEKLTAMRSWMESELGTATYANPIQVKFADGEAKVFVQGEALQVQFGSGSFQPLTMTSLTPADFFAVADGIQTSPQGQKNSDFEAWKHAFSEIYGEANTR